MAATNQQTVKKTAKAHIVPAKAVTKPAKPVVEKKHDEPFRGMSMKTYIDAIGSSLIHGKTQLNLQLAVSLSVFAQSENVESKDATATLFHIYHSAGYDCSTSKGKDYKTVNRWFNYSKKFYNWMGGLAAVDELTGGTSESASIKALVKHMEEYDFNGWNAVMERIGQKVESTPERIARKKVVKEEPKTDAQPTDADKAVAGALAQRIESNGGDRRSAERDPNAKVLATEHLRLVIPSTTTQAELMQLAMDVMQLAKEMKAATKPETIAA